MAEQQVLFLRTDGADGLVFQAQAVAATGLGDVELLVGTLNPQLGGGPDPLQREGATDADRHAQVDRGRQADRRGFDGAPDALGHGHAERGLAARQHHGELFAAVAGQSVHRPDAAVQGPRHASQDLVAREVAIGVVDLLEMVDVEHQQQRRLARTRDAVDLGLQLGHEMAPVGQPRQRVLQGEFGQAIDDGLQVAGRVFFGCRQTLHHLGPQQGTCRIQAQLVQIDQRDGGGGCH